MLENPRSGLRKLRAVLGCKFLCLLHGRGLVGLVQPGRRRRAGRQRDTDLREELFLPDWHAEAQQPHRVRAAMLDRIKVTCAGISPEERLVWEIMTGRHRALRGQSPDA